MCVALSNYLCARIAKIIDRRNHAALALRAYFEYSCTLLLDYYYLICNTLTLSHSILFHVVL